MKNEQMFKQYMTALCEIHNKTTSTLLLSLYWKVLEPFTDEQCEEAFKQLIYEGKFFPKPADFNEILRGSKEDRAVIAWGEVVEAIRRTGPYQSVCFADTTIHSVIEFMGGWPATGDWPESELKWKQKEFERLYAIMKDKGSDKKYLPGIQEIENAANGFEINPPIMIGGGRKLIEASTG